MKNIILIFTIILSLYISYVYPATIEDIRTRTKWQSPNHSERDSVYIPLIKPSNLIAYLDKYHRDLVKLKALFHSVSMRDLNVWIGPKGNKHRFSSTRYISFSIKDPDEQISSKDIILFISKGNPDSDKVFNIPHNTPVLVTGRVRDTTNGKARIEVSKIEVL